MQVPFAPIVAADEAITPLPTPEEICIAKAEAEQEMHISERAESLKRVYVTGAMSPATYENKLTAIMYTGELVYNQALRRHRVAAGLPV